MLEIITQNPVSCNPHSAALLRLRRRLRAKHIFSERIVRKPY